MRRLIILAMTHGAVFIGGFALGVFLLPILIAPDSPDAGELRAKAQGALYTAEFTRDLSCSDFLHWGKGTVSIAAGEIVHEGSLAPGPDYKLYLVDRFVEDEAGFEAVKANAVRVGDVKTFDGFPVTVPDGIDISAYNTVLVWCERFSEFITAAKYR